MEWGCKENRIAIIALHKVGFAPMDIFKTLKKLGINRMFIHRTINRYIKDGRIDDNPRSGRPRDIRTKNAICAVRNRINRNPRRHQKIMAREMGISKRTMSRIIRDDLGMKAYRRRTGQYLTLKLQEQRVKKSKVLLSRYGAGRYRDILFCDEKVFDVEESYNRQNDRVYARSSIEAQEKVPRIQRAHHPASVMVWWGVSYDGVTKAHFCAQGVKTCAKNYQSDILIPVVEPLSNTLFKNKNWIFQQDSAPAHKAKTTQAWLQAHVPQFISPDEWPAGSPDLNPLDYTLWDKLEDMVCTRRYQNINSLKSAISTAIDNFPIKKVRESIDAWPSRLRACIKARGNHFE